MFCKCLTISSSSERRVHYMDIFLRMIKKEWMSFKFTKTKKNRLLTIAIRILIIFLWTIVTLLTLKKYWADSEFLKKEYEVKLYIRTFSWRKLFSSPKLKVHVSFSYQLMSVICLSFLSVCKNKYHFNYNRARSSWNFIQSVACIQISSNDHS